MIPIFSFVLFLGVCSAASVNNQKPQQKTVLFSPEVTFVAEKYTSEDDSSKGGWAFFGIRYGKAPRFQTAVSNDDFSYMKDPSHPKQGYVCPQRVMPPMLGFPPRNLSMSEDCLYLDIYIPDAATKEKKELPVMFWIHGGGFQFGDKDLFNAAYLACAIDAIIVTVNYRLNAFGFLSTGDDAAKGNYGLGDLKLALEWTKQNIDKFGGNASFITIFGESAGGAAVSALFLDPKVQDSIIAGVAMSGSIFSAWAMSRNPKVAAEKLGAGLGCPNGASSTELVECLKNASMDQLLKVDRSLTLTMDFGYAPVVDGEHIAFPDLQSLVSQSQRPSSGKAPNFISGYLKEDSALLLMLMVPPMFNQTLPFNLTTAKGFIMNYLAPLTTCPQTLLGKVLDEYHFSESDSRNDLVRKVTHFATDASFGYPAIKESYAYANRSFSSQVPNQLYLISYDSAFNNLGAFHGMDIMYAFGGAARKMVNITINPKVTSSMRTMLRQVAYDGRISGPDYGAQGAHVDLTQSGKFEKGQTDLSLVVKFWNDLLKTNCE